MSAFQGLLAYRIKVLGNPRRRDVIGIAFIFGFAIINPLRGSVGWDFEFAYRFDALNHSYGIHTWNPYPAYWLFMLFSILPVSAGFLLWNLISACGFVSAIKYLHGDYLAFSLSLPCFWIFYAGQYEGFIALGLVLAMLPSPVLSGIGLTLLSFKPQVGLIIILFALWRQRNWKILVVPAIVYILSLVYWGWWVPDWLLSIGRVHLDGTANISLFPYGLLLLPFLFWGRSSLKIGLAIESVVVPYFPVYSLAVVFCLTAPWWSAVLLWGLYLSAGITNYPILPGFVVPLGILVPAVLNLRKLKNAARNARVGLQSGIA